jgi:hypothetical protein
MCLLPIGGFGGQQMPPIPPNEKAKKLGDYLRIAIYFHFGLAAFALLTFQWINGIFDLLGATIGYMGIKSPEGYNFQSVICYLMFTGMQFIWAIVRMILFFSNADDSSAPGSSWQLNVFVGVLVAAPIIYLLASVLAYHLYKELRAMLQDPNAESMQYDPSQGMPPQQQAFYNSGGTSGTQYAAQPRGGAQWSHPEVHPPTDAGFKPFSGSGHKLGGS